MKEMKEAIKALRVAERNFAEAEPAFYDAAWYALLAAKAKVDALAKGA